MLENINIWNLIIFIGVLHGFLFSGILFTANKYRSVSNNFLAYTVLSLAVSNLQYWFLDVGIISNNAPRISTELLIVPMFFLFVNSYLQYKTDKKYKVLLIIPFVFSLIISVINFIGLLKKESLKRIINIIQENISSGYTLVLIGLVCYRIWLYEKESKEFSRRRVISQTKWIKQILIIGFTLCVFWIGEIYYMLSIGNTGLSIYYPLWIGISFLIYWIAYVGVFKSHILTERTEIRNKEYPTISKEIQNKSFSLELFSKINSFIIEEKNYLNPNISLNFLAAKFDKKTSYISNVISKNIDSSFTDYINTFRVTRAKELLRNPDYNKYTIIAIGLESGFKSKSNFYTVFKKHTDLTPLEYKKSPETLDYNENSTL